MLRYFEAPKQRTPTGIVGHDANMLLMENRIMLSKLTYVGKLMAKSAQTNLCRRALNNGKLTCKGKDLLTECQKWYRHLRIKDVTKGCLERNMIKLGSGKKTRRTYKSLWKTDPKSETDNQMIK